MNAKGKVYLVGAGPGHTDLMTSKAARLLAEADVVLYDRLVSEGILEQHKVQKMIFDLLVRYAMAGKMVVRRKGGDRLAFGRGAEEWALLRERGIDVALVPCISSSIAAPVLAGIPVTYRGIAHDGLIQDLEVVRLRHQLICRRPPPPNTCEKCELGAQGALAAPPNPEGTLDSDSRRAAPFCQCSLKETVA
ncbi:MAG: hypothetical protein JJE04_14490 [Acidobacteriia bacterium]|nr:hypothetical protein [Terriglobia bacterium]